jgi:hypothetical protein
MKKHGRNGKAADAKVLSNTVFAIKRTPNPQRPAAGEENAKSTPATHADLLTPKPPKQRNNARAAQREKNKYDKYGHARRVVQRLCFNVRPSLSICQGKNEVEATTV